MCLAEKKIVIAKGSERQDLRKGFKSEGRGCLLGRKKNLTIVDLGELKVDVSFDRRIEGRKEERKKRQTLFIYKKCRFRLRKYIDT